MTRHELEELQTELNAEFANRQRLGGYSTDAPLLTLLTRTCLVFSRHLIEVDKEIAKLKRLSSVTPKKK